MGLVAGSFCPHWDGESLRRPRYEEIGRLRRPAGRLSPRTTASGSCSTGRELGGGRRRRCPASTRTASSAGTGNAVEETQIRARLLR